MSQDRNVKVKSYANDTIKSFPRPTSHVSDFEDILTVDQERYLDSLITSYADSTTNQIAVVTIKSISPYDDILVFATDLGTFWGVGQADKDNGLLIAISKNMRKAGIATGYGTEKVLKDELVKKIIDTEMIPFFKEGQYFEGIREGIVRVMEEWK